jgi:hypothetical protein
MTSRATYEKQLLWRLKQINIGKNNPSYESYARAIEKHHRRREHPLTPDPYDARMSKRQFEGRVKAWKRSIQVLFPQGNRDVGANQTQITFFLRASEAHELPVKSSANTRFVIK